jgi:hypothetical protein
MSGRACDGELIVRTGGSSYIRFGLEVLGFS